MKYTDDENEILLEGFWYGGGLSLIALGLTYGLGNAINPDTWYFLIASGIFLIGLAIFSRLNHRR